MHNGQLSDPLNAYAKAMKKITAKNKKTDADNEELGRLEWFGSLYLMDGTPCIPREALKATLLRAGKTLKKGPKVKAGIVCEEHAILEYDGPKNPKELWEDKRFVYRVSKPQGQVRIMRTRPIFQAWSIDVTITFSDEQLNPGEVDDIVTIAGHTIAFLEERPEYGRFDVHKL
jgi:hypothetical protein